MNPYREEKRRASHGHPLYIGCMVVGLMLVLRWLFVVAQDGVKLPPALRPDRQEQQYELVVVTASSENHFEIGVSVLLPSLRMHLNPFTSKVVYYDIGLTAQQHVALRLAFPEVQVKTFDFELYPSHFALSENAGYWAWKPLIIFELTEQYDDALILWLDSGNQLTGPLDSVMRLIQIRGVFSQRSSSSMKKYVHPGMFAYFNLDRALFEKQANCDGAIVGIDSANATIKQLVLDPWVDCAMHKECIAPVGSSRENHRQDQAALTVLMKKIGLPCRKDEAKKHHILKHRDHTDEGNKAIERMHESRQRQPSRNVRVIVAGRDLQALQRSLHSLRQFSNPWIMNIICFGFELRDQDVLRAQFPEVEYRSYDYGELPMAQVAILHQVSQECVDCSVIWIESRYTVSGSLDSLLQQVEKHNIWSICSPTDRLKAVDEAVRALNVESATISPIGACSGELFAFSPLGATVVHDWYRCIFVDRSTCWDKISPDNSTDRDRIDLVLTVLLKRNKAQCTRPDRAFDILSLVSSSL